MAASNINSDAAIRASFSGRAYSPPLRSIQSGMLTKKAQAAKTSRKKSLERQKAKEDREAISQKRRIQVAQIMAGTWAGFITVASSYCDQNPILVNYLYSIPQKWRVQIGIMKKKWIFKYYKYNI
jgi:hypothetical protein